MDTILEIDISSKLRIHNPEVWTRYKTKLSINASRGNLLNMLSAAGFLHHSQSQSQSRKSDFGLVLWEQL